MGNDFRIGLIVGLVLMVVTLVWVATRPSLSPEARLLGPAAVGSRDRSPPSGTALRPPDDGGTPRPGPVTAGPGASLPAATATLPVPTPAVSRPNHPDLTIYEQAQPIQTTKFHIVRKNETLSSISQVHYGTPNRWQKILQANRDIIKDANKITPGTKLTIPD